MLTLEVFMNQLQVLRDFQDKKDERQKLVGQMYTSSFVIDEFGDDLFTSYIRFLALMMNDDGEWIDYYIFETQWGKEIMDITVNDKHHDLRSYEDLYDIITVTMKTN